MPYWRIVGKIAGEVSKHANRRLVTSIGFLSFAKRCLDLADPKQPVAAHESGFFGGTDLLCEILLHLLHATQELALSGSDTELLREEPFHNLIGERVDGGLGLSQGPGLTLARELLLLRRGESLRLFRLGFLFLEHGGLPGLNRPDKAGRGARDSRQ